jgi:RNA polymerase sigma-70 factor (ECF subfamily)
VAGKVLSIWPVYQDSTLVMSAGGRYRNAAYAEEPTLVRPFAKVATGQLTLFRMTGPDSPFLKAVPGFMGGKEPPACYAQYFLLIRGATASHPIGDPPGADGISPVVVTTVPASGSNGVSSALAEIRVTFSKEMANGSFSVVQVSSRPDAFPKIAGPPSYDASHRTLILPVKLEPGKTYELGFNNEQFRNFTDTMGHSAVPYRLVFRTAGK